MLDNYLQKYFWTFIIGVVGCAASLTASITNVFAARALQPPVKSMFVNATSTRRTISSKSPLQVDEAAFLSRNLFDAEREDLVPQEEPEEEVETPKVVIDAGACNPTRCRASGMSANLVATWWFGETSEANMAMFQPTSGGNLETLRVGDELLSEAEVTSVLRNTVCVSRAGSCEIFTLDAPKKKTRRVASAAVRPSSTQNSQSTVKKLGDKAYEIERSEVDSVLSNLNKIARQARIVPSFKNGKSNGFKLFSIRRGSLYDKLGIKNGDIIQKINGYEMSSPEKVLEIYTKLKDSSGITVNLMRRGKPQTMRYSIK